MKMVTAEMVNYILWVTSIVFFLCPTIIKLIEFPKKWDFITFFFKNHKLCGHQLLEDQTVINVKK